jgi:hypothetical protein
MKREELLAWAGVVLAIPPIVYMVFSEGKPAAGTFVVLLLAFLIYYYIQSRRGENRPTFTLLSVRKRYTFSERDSKSTSFENVMLIRANHRAESFINSHLGG